MLTLALLACLQDAPEPNAPLRARYGFSDFEIYELDDETSHLSAGDVDGDGRTDLALWNPARSRVDLLLRLPPQAADQPDPDFDPEDPNALAYPGRFRHVPHAVGRRVLALALGDLDGDGRAELVLAKSGGRLCAVFDPAGDSRTLERELDELRAGVSALACADADGDGRDDVLVGGQGAVLLLALAHDGSTPEGLRLTPPRMLEILRDSPSGLHFCDLDGDGRSDLLAVHRDERFPFRLRMGTAGGGFGPRVELEWPQLRSSHVADLSGKGRGEILAVWKVSGRLARLAVERSQEPRLAVAHAPFRPSEGRAERTFGVGDLTGDGTDEVVVAHPGAAQVSVYLGGAGGRALERIDSPSLAGVADPRAADLDGDGRAELVVVSGSERMVGVARLEESGRVPFPTVHPVEGEPLALDAADVDADGRDDLVLVTMRGQGRQREFALEVLAGTAAGLGGRTLHRPLPELEREPEALRARDLDRDGRVDVVLFPSGSSAQPMILLRTEAGFVQDERGEDVPGLGVLEGSSPANVGHVDADGDGREELLVAAGGFARSLWLEIDDPAGARLVPRVIEQFHPPAGNAKIAAATAADLSGDGSAEVVLFDAVAREVLILERASDGSTRLAERIGAGRAGDGGLLPADLDGDGAEEVLLFWEGGFGVLARAPGVPLLRERASYDPRKPDLRLDRIAVGDLDGDGGADVALTEVSEHAVVILKPEPSSFRRALGFEVFDRRTFAASIEGREPREIVCADLSGDGLDDLALLVHDKLVVYLQESVP